jgi:ABC-2 type transport system ATP-binding protein
VFGLLGLNGSGKTTTIKLIVGLVVSLHRARPTCSGPRRGRPRPNSSVGYLPEIPYFYKYLSGKEVLRFYGRLSGIAESRLNARIDEVLAHVRMTANAGRPMREYSKGMLQRIALAQSMLHDPRN